MALKAKQNIKDNCIAPEDGQTTTHRFKAVRNSISLGHSVEAAGRMDQCRHIILTAQRNKQKIYGVVPRT